ncbi:MTRF1L release factor glutamine methyltransferase [Conger conger]|uniref:MTRF1L release factor glutamine methyltransferase n=1 Tax=Conger conger TaxID=82655 RepID=UPI002A5A56B5|nr:MTRF1L release factor glutamine methyltransferase [Conger conger]
MCRSQLSESMDVLIKLNRLGCAVRLHKGRVRHQSLRSASGGRDFPPVSHLNVQQATAIWEQRFRGCGVSEPYLSSQYIMAHILGAKTMASLDPIIMTKELTGVQTHRFWELCSKRLARMPVQYVIEEWDFRDLTLKMRPPVFIPRPETEELVGLVLAGFQSRWDSRVPSLRCLELCCGSGAVSLSLLHSLPQLSVVAVDKSTEAVSLTQENAHRLGLQDRLEVRQLDLTVDAEVILKECGPVDILVSNPPYLFSQDMTSLEPEILRFEDPAALDGGADGLQIIAQILTLAPHLLKDLGFVYLEVDPRHPPVIQKFAEEEKIGLEYIQTHYDITNRPRFCVLQRRGAEN